MKIILSLMWMFLILMITDSKAQTNKNTNSTVVTSSGPIGDISGTDELYIGKEFYSGDELNAYTFITSKIIDENDSLTYSIYKKNGRDRYVFSVEKLIKDEDKESYKILDLFRFTNFKSENHRIKILNTTNGYTVLFLNRDGILKKWESDLKSRKIVKIWNGIYKCNFLRIREESADPRAYAMIVITIVNNNATFQLDGYNEILNKKLMVLNRSSNKITLYEKGKTDSQFSIAKINNEFILTSDLLNKITGETATYKLDKD